MKELAHYTIPLNPRPKKNTHRISGCGPRCPVCKKYQRQFVRNGAATTDFGFQAAKYLQPKPLKPIEKPVQLVYRLYRGTKHRVDDLNLYEALDDILVKEKILADDNITIIRSRDGSRCFHDRDNPRCEITIYDYEEETHGAEDENLHR